MKIKITVKLHLLHETLFKVYYIVIAKGSFKISHFSYKSLTQNLCLSKACDERASQTLMWTSIDCKGRCKSYHYTTRRCDRILSVFRFLRLPLPIKWTMQKYVALNCLFMVRYFH